MTERPEPASPAPGERSDLDLLRAHVAGDRDAFAELFRRHRDRLWAVALRTIGDREEAADALQDALLSAHRSAARFRGDAAVTTWLHRIVVNACLDRLRRHRAHPTVPLPDGARLDPDAGPGPRGTAGVEPAAPAVDHDVALDVRQALAALPSEQRVPIVLVDLEGYPVAEVAAMLGVAEGTVKSRCFRARARLAVLLGHLRAAPADVDDAGHAAAAGNRRAAGSVSSASVPPAAPEPLRTRTAERGDRQGTVSEGGGAA